MLFGTEGSTGGGRRKLLIHYSPELMSVTIVEESSFALLVAVKPECVTGEMKLFWKCLESLH